MEDAIISGVVGDDSEAKITIGGVPDQPGVAASVFRALASADVNVDMIVQNTSLEGRTDISFTIPVRDLEMGLEACRSRGNWQEVRLGCRLHQLPRVSVPAPALGSVHNFV